MLAHGRDPYFAGWPDTLQLNYGNPLLQQAMIGELLRIAGQCDGVRCDMAMLVLPEVFERTWGIAAEPFWPKATQRVREQIPGSVSWPRSTGTWNGRCCSRDSTMRTTSGSTTVCGRDMRDRCASTCTRDSTTRASWRASWRTTTSRGRRPRLRRRCTRPPPSSRISRRACGSSTRGSSRAGGNGSRRTWSGRRTSPSTWPSNDSTNVCWPS